MAMQLNDFARGQRVKYVGSRPELYGREARVIRAVKSRGVVTIEWAEGHEWHGAQWYDTGPNTLEVLP